MDIEKQLRIWQRLDERRFKLAAVTEFEAGLYSRQWRALYVGYNIMNLPNVAAVCRSNAERYGQMAGTWRRVPNGAYVELEYVR